MSRPCECGQWSGERCQGDLADGAVRMEFTPEWLRESHTAAGNCGVYPHNGAERVRVTPDCAAAMLEHDADWCDLVGGEIT